MFLTLICDFWAVLRAVDTQNRNFLMVIDANAVCVDVNVLRTYDFRRNKKKSVFFWAFD